MKLQQVQRYGVENFVEFTAAGVDEQAHRGNKRRQRGNDRSRLMHINRPRTLRVKDQPNGVSARLGRCQRIFYTGNPADFAANC